MKSYKVLHLGAGKFVHGQIVTEEQILEGNHDLAGWLQSGAVAEHVPPKEPTLTPAKESTSAPK
jgi:hypothetical protein